jgi:hypothetical protein
MADIICAKCSEPWDAYGVRNGDMDDTPEYPPMTVGAALAANSKGANSRRFLKGEGCPCCNFGEHCSSCDGCGREDSSPPRCSLCRDRGYLLAWRPRTSFTSENGYTYVGGYSYTGYSPNVQFVPKEFCTKTTTIGVRKLPEHAGTRESRDGTVDEWWVVCVEGCSARPATPCSACDGEGTLTPVDEDLQLLAAQSEINASDEDPYDILKRRGLS